MKRYPTLMLCAVAAGLVFAVGIAWLGAFFGTDLAGSVSLATPNDRDAEWFESAVARVADEFDTRGTVLRFGAIRRTTCVDVDQFVSYGRGGVIIVFRSRSGWPLRCVSGAQWAIDSGGGQSSETIADGALIHRSARFGERIVPWRPIWIGLIGNTLFSGGVVAATLMAIARARRSVRRRRGRCPWCAYPRHNDLTASCSECGR